MNYWVAVGTQANWERGLEQGIWGMIARHANLWKLMKENDTVIFHCTQPVARSFGFGLVTGTFKQDQPLWAEEVQKNKIIWPYRFSFKPILLLPFQDWSSKGVNSYKYGLPINAGINHVTKTQNAVRTIDYLKYQGHFDPSLTKVDGARETIVSKPKLEKSIHEVVQDNLVEIGSMQRFFADKEVPFENGRLDVTWKRQLRSVPTYVFEVQVSGNLQNAIGKLKSANDIWNSKIILVTESSQHETAKQLSSGMFWEVRDTLKIMTIENIKDLYDAKMNYYAMEKQFGLM